MKIEVDYQVICGNIGTVYSWNDWNEAKRTYSEYKRQSQDDYGRASGEPVTLMEDDEPKWEHIGTADTSVTRFRDLALNQSFEFDRSNFSHSGMEHGPWIRTSARCYEKPGMKCQVGSINVHVLTREDYER